MSAAPTWGRPASTLEVVWGPAYPLLLVLLGFPGLLALLLAVGSRDEVPLMAGFTSTLGGISALLALSAAAWGVQRQARVQRIWAARLAPRSAGLRVAQAVALGLALTWLTIAAPLVLLWWTQSALLQAVAAASLLAALMLATTAWACAWQGRLAAWGLLPLLVGTGAVITWGPSALWAIWLGAGWMLHTLVGAACGGLLFRVLAAQGRAGRRVPALVWQGWIARARRLWPQRYRVVREPGEDQASLHWTGFIAPVFGSCVGSGLVNRGSSPGMTFSEPNMLAVSDILLCIVCLALSYRTVCSADLHWRHWLAPGAHKRQHLGARVLWHSLQAHAKVGLLLVLVALGLAAVWPTADRLALCVQVAGWAGVIALHWLLALPAAVWLRGVKAGPTRRFMLAMALVLSWAIASLALLWAGQNTRSELLLALVPLSALLLMPLILRTWRQRDLTDFTGIRTDANKDAT